MNKIFNLNRKNFRIIIPVLNFIIGTFLVVIYSFIDHIIFKNDISKINIEKISSKIVEREEYFSDFIKGSKRVLLGLRDNRLFENYLEKKENSKLHLEHLFENAIKLNSSIMQIRFINKEGYEKIKYSRGSPYIDNIKKIEQLQNKSGRYYFKENIRTTEGIWYSALDLNEEHGMVEVPYNPTYRAVLPVIDKGEFKGMIVVNYFAKIIFDKLFFMPLYDSVLIDKEGYILQHYNKAKRWSRYSHDKIKIDKKYFDHIKEKRFLGEDYGMKKLDLPFTNELFLILKLGEKNLLQQEKVYHERAVILISTFISLIFFISLILYFILKQYERKKEQVKKLSKTKIRQEKILKQKSKMAAMGEMIANIAHQWRQPLALLSYHNINLERKIKNNKLSDEFLDGYIKDVNETIEGMDRIIEDFSSFFKPNKEKTMVELNEILKESLNLLKKTFHHDTINVELYSSKKYYCFGYKNELLHVILNILNNAKDAIEKNNIEDGEIIINVFEVKTGFIIAISDNGGGIKPELLDRVFEPYFSTKFKSNGVGIGLYMSKMIIEDSLNGKIYLENKNKGTLCTIKLPKG